MATWEYAMFGWIGLTRGFYRFTPTGYEVENRALEGEWIMLANAGLEGWELTAIVKHQEGEYRDYYFRRPLSTE